VGGKSLALVVNPSAKYVKKRFLCHDRFWEGIIPEELVGMTRSLDELEAVIDRFRVMGVRNIACLGGDGSLQHLVNTVLRSFGADKKPAILPLAGGTMNGLARAMTGSMPPRIALKAAYAGRYTVERRNILKVSNIGDGCDLYGFSFATGLPVRALENYYRAKEPGIADALRASMLPITGMLFRNSFYRPTGIELKAGDDRWPVHPHSILASVLENPLLWFRPFGSVGETSGEFYLAATDMSPAALALRIWPIFRGRCRHPGMRTGQVTCVTVRTATGYVIDGELGGIGESLAFRISLGPEVDFLVPQVD